MKLKTWARILETEIPLYIRPILISRIRALLHNDPSSEVISMLLTQVSGQGVNGEVILARTAGLIK